MANDFRRRYKTDLPPTSTMGFGLYSVSSRIRVPRPPASRTTFMVETALDESTFLLEPNQGENSYAKYTEFRIVH